MDNICAIMFPVENNDFQNNSIKSDNILSYSLILSIEILTKFSLIHK
jgi:hypothetical protein